MEVYNIDSKSELIEKVNRKNGVVVGINEEAPDTYCLAMNNDYMYGIIGNGRGVKPIILDSDKIFLIAVGDKLYAFYKGKLLFALDNQAYLIDELILLSSNRLAILSQLDIKIVEMQSGNIIWQYDFDFIEDYRIDGSTVDIISEGGRFKCTLKENDGLVEKV